VPQHDQGFQPPAPHGQKPPCPLQRYHEYSQEQDRERNGCHGRPLLADLGETGVGGLTKKLCNRM
jgi:hypothetical protein